MWDFTVSGTKDVAKSAIPGEMKGYRNQRLQDALNLLVDAMPDGDRDVKVVVQGDLNDNEDNERTVTITLTATKLRERPADRAWTPEEEQRNLNAKRESYQAEGLSYRDAGRHTRNDEGEVTDVNALPVGRLKDDVSLSDRAVADAKRRANRTA